MFSKEYYEEIRAGFDRQMTLLKENAVSLDKIRAVFRACSREEAQALTFLYGAIPLSDLLDYPAELFLAYARHGVFLWNQGPFAGRVPERLFANYVLHHRVNNEDLEDVRGLIYHQLMEYDRLKDFNGLKGFDGLKGSAGRKACGGGKCDMYEAVKEVNYWCAGEASYSATDERTQNPGTVLKAAIGRCGEESVLTVTALRSMGIPARQVYVPLWSHCDDNHAWVEAWCDGEWRFLGACEPQERLDRGWFTGAASRAMLVRSRWFGPDAPEGGETEAGRSGMARNLNHLERYASVVHLMLTVVDEKGTPVPGARLELQILNQGRLRTMTVLRTGTGEENCGTAEFFTGRGDLWVSASAGGLYGEKLVSLTGGQADAKECVLVLKQEPECREEWKELDFHAPAETVREEELTALERHQGADRLKEAEERRRHKLEGFFDEIEADRSLDRYAQEDRQALKEILRKARGNVGELVNFLNREPGEGAAWKRKLLETLREKDLWDIRTEVLTDCWNSARFYEGSLPEDIFFPYVACPRVDDEMLRPCRRELLHLVDSRDQERIRWDPGCVPELAEGRIRSLPEREYEGLITSPAGCLRGGIGSLESKRIFCVTLCRSLGIPARLNPLDGRTEYWREGRWICAEEPLDPWEEGAFLTLFLGEGLKLKDTDQYSLERFDGEGFRYLNLENYWRDQNRKPAENRIPGKDTDPGTGENGPGTLVLRPGVYRITATVRKKNGDQLVRMLTFRLQKGQKKEITLSLREVLPEDMLIHARAEEIVFRTPEGERVPLSGLGAGAEEEKAGEAGPALLLWLETGREPTEHILNELYELRDRFRALSVPMYMVVKNPEELKNSTLIRTWQALPEIRILLQDPEEKARKLAESVGQESGRLPLALVLASGLECVYSSAGYRTGQGGILWRILHACQKKFRKD
ncbi:MAG: transglutaminase-like domain-containing protein [Acetatifactor sp.]|nr:transglutaminase-like domain-containing protein [Acetatifactor sp.]